MPTREYYREQARLLIRWATMATDPGVAERLSYRAHNMLQLAGETAETVRDRQPYETLNAALFRQRSSRLR